MDRKIQSLQDIKSKHAGLDLNTDDLLKLQKLFKWWDDKLRKKNEMKLLGVKGIGSAVNRFIEKDDKDSIGCIVDRQFQKSVDKLMSMVDIEDEQVDEQVNQQIEEMLQRLFTIRPITQPTPQHNLPFNPRNTIYIPMIIPMNYSEDNDPDLQEAIRQSLGS